MDEKRLTITEGGMKGNASSHEESKNKETSARDESTDENGMRRLANELDELFVSGQGRQALKFLRDFSYVQSTQQAVSTALIEPSLETNTINAVATLGKNVKLMMFEMKKLSNTVEGLATRMHELDSTVLKVLESR